jgi:3-deoxy-D-manno-octulosonic-acid transferase
MKRVGNELRKQRKAKFSAQQQQDDDDRPHYKRMKELLGDVPVHRASSGSSSDKMKLLTRNTKKYPHIQSLLPTTTSTLKSDNDSTFTVPERDVRALQYDACSEYWAYGKS